MMKMPERRTSHTNGSEEYQHGIELQRTSWRQWRHIGCSQVVRNGDRSKALTGRGEGLPTSARGTKVGMYKRVSSGREGRTYVKASMCSGIPQLDPGTSASRNDYHPTKVGVSRLSSVRQNVPGLLPSRQLTRLGVGLQRATWVKRLLGRFG